MKIKQKARILRVDWPYKFPHPGDVIAADAEQFRQLTVSERLEKLFTMIDGGQLLLSPARRAIHDRLKDEAEAAWQAAHREVFLRHGR